MRIISGKHKGRTINTPNNLPVRPTTDFAKESIFNIINNNFDFETISVLDLFCGTGNISYEFCSRGATHLIAVDIDFKCYAFVKETFKKYEYKQARIVRNDVFLFLDICKEQYDIIFADPPFSHAEIAKIPTLVFEKKLLNTDGWLIVEHPKEIDLSALPHFWQQRTYGKVNFSVFKN